MGALKAVSRADQAVELAEVSGRLMEEANEVLRGCSTEREKMRAWASIIEQMRKVKTEMAELYPESRTRTGRTLPSDAELREQGLEDMIPLVERHRRARIALHLQMGLARAQIDGE